MKSKILILIIAVFFSNCKSSTNKQLIYGDKSKAEKIVDYSKKQIGTNYKSGGKQPETGFDCSGFTCYIFKKVDISLTSTAALQASQGKAIFVTDAQKGDLIFFKGGNKNDSKVGHVGIIISNKTEPIKFIHASTSKGIMTSLLSEKYFKERLIKIRRIIF